MFQSAGRSKGHSNVFAWHKRNLLSGISGEVYRAILERGEDGVKWASFKNEMAHVKTSTLDMAVRRLIDRKIVTKIKHSHYDVTLIAHPVEEPTPTPPVFKASSTLAAFQAAARLK